MIYHHTGYNDSRLHKLKQSVKEGHAADLERISGYKKYYEDFYRQHGERPSNFEHPQYTRSIVQYKGVTIETLKPSHVNRQNKALIYLKGCAYVSYLTDGALAEACRCASETDVSLCICMNHRIAPENTYKEMLHDVVHGYEYLLSLGYRAKDIIIAGDSSGGATALATALLCRDIGYDVPGKIIMFSPWANIAMDTRSYKDNMATDCMLGHTGLLQYASSVYGVNEDKSNIYVYPCYANMREMVSMLIIVGTDDIVYDDSVAIEQRCTAANVPCYMHVFDDLFHEFQTYETPAADIAWSIVRAYCAEEEV